VAKTDLICETCRTKVDAVFNPTTGTRVIELINGQRLHEDCCFVADEIHFTGNSQLVFAPTGKGKEGRYCQEYYVVCRKLVISGGHEVKDFTPCSPDDPGQAYSGNNVITWQHRLNSADNGADASPPQAPQGTNHNQNVWSDVGQGSPHGADGGDGPSGNPGNPGDPGFTPTPNVVVLALEVEAGAGDHLTIDFDGQNGGKGGKGQDGGDGGDGMGGRNGESDTSWPGEGCDRQPGNGGDGGDGGRGGTGGPGGRGGNGGTIAIVSTPANIASGGVFLGPRFSYVNDGGDGGKGGKGGIGGKGGKKGNRGNKSQLCDEAVSGEPGDHGFPENFTDAADGPGGGHGGGGGSPLFEPVKTGTCADQIPFPALSVTSVTPASGAQGAAVAVTIAGVGFAPAATVDVSGIGVAVSGVTVVNPAQITCTFTIGGAAPKTARDVTVKNSLVHTATLTGGFTVT
jgi:hypothetical protein